MTATNSEQRHSRS